MLSVFSVCALFSLNIGNTFPRSYVIFRDCFHVCISGKQIEHKAGSMFSSNKSTCEICRLPSPVLSRQFVLKHEALAHLREVALFPNTLNPHKAESLALVGAMIDQVMELHPGARWLHIGCDEVGACFASSTVLPVSSRSRLHLVSSSLK